MPQLIVSGYGDDSAGIQVVRRNSFKAKSPTPIVTTVNMPKDDTAVQPKFSPRFENVNPMALKRSLSNPRGSVGGSSSSSLLGSINAAKMARDGLQPQAQPQAQPPQPQQPQHVQRQDAATVRSVTDKRMEPEIEAPPAAQQLPQAQSPQSLSTKKSQGSFLSAFTDPLADYDDEHKSPGRDFGQSLGEPPQDLNLVSFAHLLDSSRGVRARLFLRQNEAVLEKSAYLRRSQNVFSEDDSFELELPAGSGGDSKKMRFQGADVRYAKPGVGKKSAALITEHADLCMHIFLKGKGELSMAFDSMTERDLAVMLFTSIASAHGSHDEDSIPDDSSVASSSAPHAQGLSHGGAAPGYPMRPAVRPSMPPQQPQQTRLQAPGEPSMQGPPHGLAHTSPAQRLSQPTMVRYWLPFMFFVKSDLAYFCRFPLCLQTANPLSNGRRPSATIPPSVSPVDSNAPRAQPVAQSPQVFRAGSGPPPPMRTPSPSLRGQQQGGNDSPAAPPAAARTTGSASGKHPPLPGPPLPHYHGATAPANGNGIPPGAHANPNTNTMGGPAGLRPPARMAASTNHESDALPKPRSRTMSASGNAALSQSQAQPPQLSPNLAPRGVQQSPQQQGDQPHSPSLLLQGWVLKEERSRPVPGPGGQAASSTTPGKVTWSKKYAAVDREGRCLRFASSPAAISFPSRVDSTVKLTGSMSCSEGPRWEYPESFLIEIYDTSNDGAVVVRLQVNSADLQSLWIDAVTQVIRSQ
jgi:hypothetical protein